MSVLTEFTKEKEASFHQSLWILLKSLKNIFRFKINALSFDFPLSVLRKNTFPSYLSFQQFKNIFQLSGHLLFEANFYFVNPSKQFINTQLSPRGFCKNILILLSLKWGKRQNSTGWWSTLLEQTNPNPKLSTLGTQFDSKLTPSLGFQAEKKVSGSQQNKFPVFTNLNQKQKFHTQRNKHWISVFHNPHTGM